MAGRQLGDAYITISPDTRLFRTLTDAQIKKELAGFNPKVRIGADTKSAEIAITSFQKRVGELSKQLSSMRADAQTKDAEAKIVRVQGKVLDLAKQMRGLTMTADAKKLDAQIASEVAKLKGLQAQMTSLQADADTKKAAAEITALQAQAFHLQESLDKGKLKARVDITNAETKLKYIDARLRALGDNAKAVKLAADNRAILTQIEVVKASISGLQAQAKDIRLGANLDPAKILAAEAALLGIEHTVEALGKRDAPVAGTAMGAFFSSMNRGSTAASYGWKILTGHITLMGGVFNKLLPKMFTSVAVWHLLIDAAIEVLAVWAPAIVAVTAFGAAASDAAKEVFHRFQAVNTEFDATHRLLPGLSKNFEMMHAAVRPQVYQLLGDALLVLKSRGGALNSVVTGTGRVLDQLAARFVYAVTTGNGVNKFMEHAVSDVSKLGDSFANFGAIIGAVFRAVPGYAEILLSVGDGILHVIAVATSAAEPIIAVGLALHGFFIYGGLAVTMSLALVAGVVKLIGAFGKFNEAVTLVGLNSLKAFALGLVNGIKGAVGYSVALIGLARSEGVAAAGSIALADAQTLLSKVPTIFWITLAASAIAGLVLWLRSAHTATQDFVGGLQKTVAAADLAHLLTTIQGAQVQVTTRLAAAQKTLANTSEYVTAANVHTGQAITAVSGAYSAAKANVDTLHAAQSQLASQYQTVSGRVSGLAKTYGGTTQALGALNLAGITTSQILDKNNTNWQIALIQVEATTAAYKAMGVQAGQLGNDLDVLGRTETDHYTATQKLNQAWSSFITDVTGTQGAFDTVIQGFQTLNGHSGDLKLTLGKLKATFADTTTSIKNVGAVATATASVASAQNALNKLQSSGKGTALQLAAAHARLTGAQDRLTVAQNNLAAAQKQGTSAIDALTPAGVALNQAFTDQVQNIDKLFASWRTAGLANNLFTQGVKAAIIPMVKYAGGSREATAQLVALAEEAGYQGPISLQALNKWLGNTHGSVQKLKDITDQATAQEALLTGAMQAQGSFIANRLLSDINNAILKYNGVEAAARAYGNAVAKSGAQSDAAHSARQRLIDDIIKSGHAAGDSKDQIAAMITKVLGIPPKKALQLVMNGLGEFSIKQIQSGLTNPGGGKSATALLNPGHAAGGFISMGSGPTADDVPIMASRGEYVVKAASVNKYGTGFMDAVNSGTFAAGGLAGKYAGGGLLPHSGNLTEGGNTSVLTGQYAYDQLGALGGAMQAAMVPAMRAALKSAESAASAMAGGYAGPGSGNYAADIQAVLRLFGLPLSLTANWLRQIQTESGGRLNAVNLTDINAQQGHPSVGLLQLIPGTFHAYAGPYVNTPPLVNYGGGTVSLNPMAQIYAAINYARHTYPDMAAVIGHGHGYALGGIIRAMAGGGMIGDEEYASGGLTGISTHQITGLAAGGRIPLGKYLPQLKRAQHNEYEDYAGLRKAYLADLAHAKAGSWTSGHRAGIRSELGTLAKHQSAEEAAYASILHHGTAKANLSKFGTRIRAVARTSRDKDLAHSHPGWSHGLQYWLGVLTHLSQADVAPVYGGTQAKLQFPAWIAKARAAQAHEVYDYRGLENAFRAGLSHARKGTWLYANRRALGERLYAVAVRQNAEAAAWNDLNKHATGSVSDLAGLAGRIGKLGSRAKAEYGSLQPSLLGHTPGGHPGWLKALQTQLRALTSLAAAPPFNPPWAPGNLGPSHTAPGGVLRFDTGRNVLAPGLNLTWNGTGRNEALSRTGAGSGTQAITLEIAPGGGSDFEQFMFQMIQRFVRVRGGGSVQTAFGRNHPP